MDLIKIKMTLEQVSALRSMLKMEIAAHFTEAIKDAVKEGKHRDAIQRVYGDAEIWVNLDRPLSFAIYPYFKSGEIEDTINANTPSRQLVGHEAKSPKELLHEVVEVEVEKFVAELYLLLITGGIYLRTIEKAKENPDKLDEYTIIPLLLMERNVEPLKKVFSDAKIVAPTQKNLEESNTPSYTEGDFFPHSKPDKSMLN